MRTTLLLGMVGLGLLAIGCGARAVPIGSPQGGASLGAAVPAAASTPDEATVDDPGSATGGSGQTIPIPAATPAHRFGEVHLRVRIEPRCAATGGALTARIATTPGAAIALAVSYSDGDTYGQFGTFRAGPDGVLRYPWTVPATAPAGTAKLIVGATDEERRVSGGGVWEFVVAPGIVTCEGSS